MVDFLRKIQRLVKAYVGSCDHAERLPRPIRRQKIDV
jgi:hypothetical protein